MACLVFQGFGCLGVGGVTWRLNFGQGDYGKEVLNLTANIYVKALTFNFKISVQSDFLAERTTCHNTKDAHLRCRLWAEVMIQGSRVLADSLEQYFRWNEPYNCSADFPK